MQRVVWCGLEAGHVEVSRGRRLHRQPGKTPDFYPTNQSCAREVYRRCSARAGIVFKTLAAVFSLPFVSPPPTQPASSSYFFNPLFRLLLTARPPVLVLFCDIYLLISSSLIAYNFPSSSLFLQLQRSRCSNPARTLIPRSLLSLHCFIFNPFVVRKITFLLKDRSEHSNQRCVSWL